MTGKYEEEGKPARVSCCPLHLLPYKHWSKVSGAPPTMKLSRRAKGPTAAFIAQRSDRSESKNIIQHCCKENILSVFLKLAAEVKCFFRARGSWYARRDARETTPRQQQLTSRSLKSCLSYFLRLSCSFMCKEVVAGLFFSALLYNCNFEPSFLTAYSVLLHHCS